MSDSCQQNAANPEVIQERPVVRSVGYKLTERLKTGVESKTTTGGFGPSVSNTTLANKISANRRRKA